MSSRQIVLTPYILCAQRKLLFALAVCFYGAFAFATTLVAPSAESGRGDNCRIIFLERSPTDWSQKWKTISDEYRQTVNLPDLQKAIGKSPGHMVIFEMWLDAVLRYESQRRQINMFDSYNVKMNRVVEATLSKHFQRQIMDRKLNLVKLTRLKNILTAIASIDGESPQIAYFQVQRLISQTSDLDQYIDCQ
jgi:hypothetical protein